MARRVGHRTEPDKDHDVERNRLEKALEIGLEETFPASDAVAVIEPATPASTPREALISAEVELKLAAPAPELEKLKCVLLAMPTGWSEVQSDLTSTYYDTPDLALHRKQLTLRVRKQGRKFVQTVKAGDFAESDLLARREWEDPVATERPDLEAQKTGKRLPDSIREQDLRPVFATLVTRTVIEIQPQPSTRIEAAIDEGEIRTADGSGVEPISEIELELKSGDPAALFDVALRLLEAAPVRIETRGKAERGYALVAADGGRPSAAHVKPVTLEVAMTVEAVLQRIGRSCLAHLLRNEPAALTGQPEGIHQMRVAVRRLRSVLSALKPMLPGEHYHGTSDELKWLAGALGPARNWDVFAANLLEPVERALPLERDLEQLAEAAEQRRRAAYDDAKQAILSQQHTAVTLKLSQWFETRGWRDQSVSESAPLLWASIGHTAPGLIERRWRQSRRRSKRFAELTPAQRHKLRIALKKLRYTIEFLQSLFDRGKVKAFMKLLGRLQDDLGYINDVRTTHELVAEVARHADDNRETIVRAGGIVLGWHDRALLDQQPRLRKHVRRLRRAKPFWPRKRIARIAT
ncbi:Inorganic triphosphatase YgiF, contains CYTH and CHAD domains [Rhizobiales bacterium GAS113]|nr:Inorganic triphosphatase YgiF, contains CYTH and CHAD domains [Rhizobiales bacterium GAS113]